VYSYLDPSFSPEDITDLHPIAEDPGPSITFRRQPGQSDAVISHIGHFQASGGRRTPYTAREYRVISALYIILDDLSCY
jgi:hypothetical protein